MLIEFVTKVNIKIQIILLLSFLCNEIIAQPDSLRPFSYSDEIIKHKYYMLSYSEKNKQAEWVFYLLTKAYVTTKSVSRADNFRPDPLVSKGSATLEDYKNGSCQRRREKVASLVSKIGKKDDLNMEERCKLTYEVQRKVSHQDTKEGYIAILKLTDDHYRSISEDCESKVNINIKLLNENVALREKINRLENEINKLRLVK